MTGSGAIRADFEQSSHRHGGQEDEIEIERPGLRASAEDGAGSGSTPRLPFASVSPRPRAPALIQQFPSNWSEIAYPQ